MASNKTRAGSKENTTQKTTTKKSGSRAGASGKSTRSQGSRSTKKIQDEHAISSDMKYELVILAFIALALELIISVYFGLGGKIGFYTRYFLFGTFGISAYILPLYILVAAFFKVFNKGNIRLNNKLSFIFIGMIIIAAFAHLAYIEAAQPQLIGTINDRSTFFAATALYFKQSATFMTTGGLIGGVIGDLLVFIIGRLGALIILVMASFSIGILITEQSIVKIVLILYAGLKKLYGLMVIAFRKLHSAWQEQHERNLERKAEQEQIEAKNLGYSGDANEIQEVPVSKSRKKFSLSFLDKATLTEKDGTQEDLITKPSVETDKMSPTEVRRVKKSDEKESQKDEERSFKIHGLDPFEQIARLEEQAKQKVQLSEERKADGSKQMTFGLETGQSAKLDEANPKKESPMPVEAIQTEIETNTEVKPYRLPPIELMKAPVITGQHVGTAAIEENAEKLIRTLESFGVGAKILDVSVGPTVTRYELQPDIGVKVSKIVNLQDDIALNLAASGIRIEAPIPGKSAIGIEVPNLETKSVVLREVIDTPEFEKFPSKVSFALGKDISGKVMIADIARMPHLLIAGATGSGKSVCVNTLITSILYHASPEEVRLLMIDPKVVELSVYNGIPHLLIPVVTDPKKAAGALNWAVQEMSDRYKLFAAANVRDLKGYNNAVEEHGEGKKLPQIVIIVDELADLMMVAPGDVEDAICRLAQMARAAGLHLIIATQRPSVDVITGLIKANIPSRIAFNVSSGVDSRTIIDTVGAEKLLGKGDMLFYPVGLQKPVRVQGAFISDKEVENIVGYLKDQTKAKYDDAIMKSIDKKGSAESSNTDQSDVDEYFMEALELVVDKEKASASMIQRRFRVGYNRAARILDQLFEAGFVGDEEGSKPRKVLLTKAAYEAMLSSEEEPSSGDGVEEEIL